LVKLIPYSSCRHRLRRCSQIPERFLWGITNTGTFIPCTCLCLLSSDCCVPSFYDPPRIPAHRKERSSLVHRRQSRPLTLRFNLIWNRYFGSLSRSPGLSNVRDANFECHPQTVLLRCTAALQPSRLLVSPIHRLAFEEHIPEDSFSRYSLPETRKGSKHPGLYFLRHFCGDDNARFIFSASESTFPAGKTRHVGKSSISGFPRMMHR